MKLFYDRFTRRERVNGSLFLLELIAILTAAVYATGMATESWSKFALLLGWVALPRLGARCLEWGGRGPTSPVGMVALIGLLTVLSGLTMWQLRFADELSTPVLLSLSALWVIGGLLYDYRFYRFHDVALLGVLIAGMAAREPGVWWAVPIVLTSWVVTTALRHLLYDVYVEQSPVPVNLQSSQAIGWISGGAASVVFLLLTGLLWWIEPAAASGPADPDPSSSEVARSEGEDTSSTGPDGDDDPDDDPDALASDDEAGGDEPADSDTTADRKAGAEDESTANVEEPSDGEATGAGGIGSDGSIDGEGSVDSGDATAELTEPESDSDDASSKAGLIGEGGSTGPLGTMPPSLPDSLDDGTRDDPSGENSANGNNANRDRDPSAENTGVDPNKSVRRRFEFGPGDFPSSAQDAPVGTSSSGRTASGDAISTGAAASGSVGSPSTGHVSPGSGLNRVGSSTSFVGPRAKGKLTGTGPQGEVVYGPGMRVEIDDKPMVDEMTAPKNVEFPRLDEPEDLPVGAGTTVGADATTGAVDESASNEEVVASLIPPPAPVELPLDYLPSGQAPPALDMGSLLPPDESSEVSAVGVIPQKNVGESGDQRSSGAGDGRRSSSSLPGEAPPILRWVLMAVALGFVVFTVRTFVKGAPDRDDDRAVAPGGGVTIVPLAASLVTRDPRVAGSPAEAVLLAYDRLQFALARRRFERRMAETPREQAQRLVERDASLSTPWDVVSINVYDALYGKVELGSSDAGAVESSCAEIERRLV